MSIILSDREFSDLKERVVELEMLLNQVEANRELPPLSALLPPEPVEVPLFTPVVSPPPIEFLPESSSAPIPQTEQVPLDLEVTAPPLAASEHEETSPQLPPEVPAEPLPTFQTTAPEDTPSFVAKPQEPPRKSLLDWETLIGGQLALWVGALCLFLALVSLLVYVGKTLPPSTPSMRVATGFAGSLALISCALAARIRGQRWFVDGLLGTGLAVGFLSVWGGGPHFGLWSIPFSVAGFCLYAGAGIVLSARRNSPTLLLLSAAGGFLTPLFIHHDNAHGVALAFSSYLLVLNIGIVAVCVEKRWHQIVYAAFTATVLLCVGWALQGNIEKVRFMLWTFASLGWLVFLGAACSRALRWNEKTTAEDAALLISATGIYAATSQWLLSPLLPGFQGAFSLGLTLLLGLTWIWTKQRDTEDELLSTSFLALSCVSGVLAIPLQFGQNGLVWGWISQSLALWFVARKSQSSWMRNSSRVLWLLALLSLFASIMQSGAATATPLDSFSLRLLFCVGMTALSLSITDDDKEWDSLYGLFITCGGAYWISRTIWLATAQLEFSHPSDHREAALLAGASAVALWALGIWRFGQWRDDSTLRGSALLFFAGSLCIIALLGIAGEAPLQGLRLASFIISAISLAVLGVWNTRYNSKDETVTSEVVAVSTSLWVLLGATISLASWFNNGHFGFAGAGGTAWFTLCVLWTILAVAAGALSLWKSWPTLWTLAETVFAAAVSTLLLQSLFVPHALLPVVNARFGAFVVAWGVGLLARQIESGTQKQQESWLLLAVLLLPLWVSTQELWSGVEAYHTLFGQEWQRFASLGVSLWWSLYAMLCLTAGVVRREQNLRVGALRLGALAVCKVFLLDLAFLDGGLRILSLGGLGVALLFISWLYSRFGRLEKSATA